MKDKTKLLITLEELLKKDFSLDEILKFNRIGKLETTNNSRQYKLKSGWREI